MSAIYKKQAGSVSDMPRVAVLLSSHGRSQYLAAQLQSILDQQGVEPVVFLRRDDPQPVVPDNLPQWADPRVRVLEDGPHLGVAGSFMRLLTLIPPHYEFVAFSDQDDFWLPHKLALAAEQLADCAAEPVLYLGGHTVVDEQLIVLRSGPLAMEVGLANAFIENQVPGCCMVINRRAHEILSQAQPRLLLMHDWWVYLVVAATGQVINDTASTGMLYRQHASNLVGDRRRSLAGELRRVTNKLPKLRHGLITAQLQEFERCHFSGLPTASAKQLGQFMALKHRPLERLCALYQGKYRRHGAGGGPVWAGQFLLGLY